MAWTDQGGTVHMAETGGGGGGFQCETWFADDAADTPW
jgi:hypothetical protein